MIMVHYTTNHSIKYILDLQNKAVNSDSFIIKDFQEFNLPTWHLTKILETNENVDIFVTKPNLYKVELLKINNIQKIANILKKDIKFNRFNLISTKRFGIRDVEFQTKIIFFDKVSFFNKNYDNFERLVCHWIEINQPNSKVKLPDFTAENIFGKTQYRNLVFVRMIIGFLLLKCGGFSVNVAKCLNKDHSTILNGREVVENYITIYANDVHKKMINTLLTNMETILCKQNELQKTN